jgi:hypothetical protein
MEVDASTPHEELVYIFVLYWSSVGILYFRGSSATDRNEG